MHKRILPVLFALTTILCLSNRSALAQGDPTDTVEVEQPEMISTHVSTVDVCGFSNDGKYFVFSQVVPGDYGGGSGYVYVIDVATNNWAHRPASLEPDVPDWAEEEIRGLAEIQARLCPGKIQSQVWHCRKGSGVRFQ